MTNTTTIKLNQLQLEVLLDAVEGQCIFAMPDSAIEERDTLIIRLVKALNRVS